MANDEGFWETLHLLIEWKKTGKDARDDVDDWVNKVVARNEAMAGKYEDDEVSVRSDDKCLRTIGLTREQEVKRFQKVVNLPPIECKFKHSQGRSRVEKLMGSNMVSLTDRNYMQRLQHRIVQDYAQSMNERIAARQEEELERVKNLVLMGKIPLEEAPPEMNNHPVMLIENYCKKILADRRARSKMQRLRLPNYLYRIDTPDPPSGWTTAKMDNEHGNMDTLANRGVADDEEELSENQFMFKEDEFGLVKYENPLIKELRACETVEEMYALADEIIGVLKTIAEKREEISEQTTTKSK